MLEISAEQLERIELILHEIPNGAEKAAYSVIKRAQTTVRSESIKAITSVYDISAKTVKQKRYTRIKSQTSKTDDGIIGEVVFAGYKIPLSKFGMKVGKSKPYRVPVLTSGGNWIMAHPGGTVFARQKRSRPFGNFDKKGTAFAATMPNKGDGHYSIFERENSRSTKLSEVQGASAAEMLEEMSVMPRVEAAAMQTISTRMEHEITRILNGHGMR